MSAEHLRGRVFIERHGYPTVTRTEPLSYEFRRSSQSPTVVMEVVNHNTGQVVASDNIALHTIYGRYSGLGTMVTACSAAVAVAREAWVYGLDKEDLR